MFRKTSVLIGIVLVVTAFVGMVAPVSAGYTLNYSDGQEYPSDSDMDIKSLSSTVSGTDINVELTVYGTISSSADYMYSILAGDDDEYTVTFACYGSGSSTLMLSSPTSTDYQSNNHTVSGDTLSFSFSKDYAGPEGEFDIQAATNKLSAPLDADSAGGDVWGGGVSDGNGVVNGDGDVDGDGVDDGNGDGTVSGGLGGLFSSIWFWVMLIVAIVVVVIIVVVVVVLKRRKGPMTLEEPSEQPLEEVPEQLPEQPLETTVEEPPVTPEEPQIRPKVPKTNAEKLELLEERFLTGGLSEKTYLKLKDKYEK